jgi:hypothetical protein
MQCPDNGQASGGVGCNYWLDTTFELPSETEIIFTETGLTPSQILEQRDELFECIKSMVSIKDIWLPIISSEEYAGEAEALIKMYNKMYDLIQKTKTN